MELTTFIELAKRTISNRALQGAVIYDDINGMEYILISSFDDSQIIGLTTGIRQTTPPYDNLADFIISEILVQNDDYFPTRDELSKIHLYAPQVAKVTLKSHFPDDWGCEISDGNFILTIKDLATFEELRKAVSEARHNKRNNN